MAGPYVEQYTEYGTKSPKTGKTPKYVVSKKSDGTWECSCPAWTNTKPDYKTGKRDDCKHISRRIIALMKAGVQAPGVPKTSSTAIIKRAHFSEDQTTRTISFEDL
jgi:hypothetical protein